MHRPRAQVCCPHNSQTCTHRHAAVHHATKSFTSTSTSTNPGRLNLHMGKAEPSACKMLSIWEILRHLNYETHFLFTLQGKLSGFFLQIATELRWLNCTFLLWFMIRTELMEITMDAQPICTSSWKVLRHLSREAHVLFACFTLCCKLSGKSTASLSLPLKKTIPGSRQVRRIERQEGELDQPGSLCSWKVETVTFIKMLDSADTHESVRMWDIAQVMTIFDNLAETWIAINFSNRV